MSISIFDIYSIGIGPSSSHTVGPMRAAKEFISEIINLEGFNGIAKIKCDFFGSLALTGKGHGTDKAFILGIQDYTPESIDSDLIPDILKNSIDSKTLTLVNGTSKKIIPFNYKKDIKFNRRVNMKEHPNSMSFAAYDEDNKEIHVQTYFSVGGGFIITIDDFMTTSIVKHHEDKTKFPFNSGKELLELCEKNQFKISDLMLQNELTWNCSDKIILKIDELSLTMRKCIQRGFQNEGILPGGLSVKRRAPKIYNDLVSNPEKNILDNLSVLDWVNLYALSVNEENAAGGQVVTAPTNGAAGIIPAVMEYYRNFVPNSTEDGVRRFLLTAGAIATLYKKNASISGAEVGCQGEVGVACSMAAAGLCEVLGGSVSQVENAAEIAMEHNLGLTCDPIGGLVQIPCIERNAMGAIKAINAARMALKGDGFHYVSLDKVIQTMKQTGRDMKKQYKETSRGGLAVNIIEC